MDDISADNANKKPKKSTIQKLSHLRSFKHLLGRLNSHADCHNRKLHYDQYVSLMSIYFFNPTLTGLRSIQRSGTLKNAKKGEAQKVKDIVSNLKKDSRPEAEEHVTTYRPWGSYTILETGSRYKIKRILVNPCEKLSMQVHYHRSEHWVVIEGGTKVTIGNRETFVHENESVYVPKSTMHRLEDTGKVPLEIFEVQNGEYTGEDDIVRCDDIYGRAN